MLNTTLVSLHVMSMASASPFYIIQSHHSGVVQSIITKSCFSHFFSSTFLSVSMNHNSIFTHNSFSYSLSTPIVFESDDSLQCGIISDQQNSIKNPIVGYTLKKIYYENETCGNVNISFCIFKDCQSDDKFGGSIRIIENCIVFIHGCQFESSHTKTNRGGAIYAVSRSGPNTNDNNEMLINDEQLSVLNIQYCCFSKCYPEVSENIYGLAVYSAASQTVLYYSTTSNCPPENNYLLSGGALFDIQATEVKSKNVNITGGYALYCAGIEYRKATQGCFKFQSFSKISQCAFVSSFSDVNCSNIEILYSNFDNITLKSSNTNIEDVNWHPGLIHVRFVFNNTEMIDRGITIEQFCFTNINEIEANPKRDARIVSRGTTWIRQNDGKDHSYEQNISITFINCVGDKSVEHMLGSEFLNHIENPTSIMRFGKPTFYDAATTFEINQLNLSDCKGVINPPTNYLAENVYDPTDAFTLSSQFTQSTKFSASNAFSQSFGFSETKEFSQTNKFSQSEKFSSSQQFSKLEQTSDSMHFSKSNEFTLSNSFNPSNGFTGSNKFTESKTMVPKSDILVEIKINDKKESSKISTNAIICISVGSAAAVIGLAALAAFILLKRRNIKRIDISEEKADICEEPETVMTNKNPLIDIMSDDDPFEKEFE